VPTAVQQRTFRAKRFNAFSNYLSDPESTMKIRLYSKRLQFVIDAGLCGVAWVLAYLVRYGGHIPPPAASRQMLLLWLPVTLGQISANALFGIYNFQWRYVNTGDALCIARVYLAYAGLLTGVALVGGSAVAVLHIPVSILATMWLLSLAGAISVRLAWRVLYRRASVPVSKDAPRRFLILGAGWHGAMVAREMLLREGGIEVIGFLDDDPEKQGAVISGVAVLGRTADLVHMVKTRGVDEVLVCISPKSRQSLHVSDVETSTGLPVRSRIIPTLEEILETTSVISVMPAVNEPPGSNGHATRFRLHGLGANPAPHTGGGHAHSVPRGNGNDGAAKLVHRVQFPASGDATRTHAMAPPPVWNKTILITGGGGFIGSNLAEKLAVHNRVMLLDQSFTHGPIQYTSLLQHPNVTLIQANLLETDLRSLVKEADVVIHAAAILGVNRVCSSARETLETNYVGTSRLLKALEAKREIQRFVYFSTSEVFGVNSYRVNEASRPSIGPIAESRWSYAMSKLAGEHLVASYFRETRMPVAIVRPFNIFGPRRTGDYALRRFILSALRDEPLTIHGDGTQIRSWCYIDDFCSALLEMIARPEAIGEDFNIGHPGNTLTIHELAQKVIQITDSHSPVVFCESPFPDIAIRVPSLDKARRLLGYEPKYDLSTGLKLTIDWHRENLELLETPVPPPTAPQMCVGNGCAA